MDRSMHRGRNLTLMMTAMAIVLLALTGTLSAQARPDARDVTLTLSADGHGKCTITVDPDVAHIWRGKSKKIKKVKWVSEPNPNYGELYWELRYDPGKGGGTGDYFGPVDLPCGTPELKVQPEIRPKIPRAEWPYSVTVYLCENGVKSTRLCSKDPRIRWDD